MLQRQKRPGRRAENTKGQGKGGGKLKPRRESLKEKVK